MFVKGYAPPEWLRGFAFLQVSPGIQLVARVSQVHYYESIPSGGLADIPSVKLAPLEQQYCGCIIDLCLVRLAVAMNQPAAQLKDTTANPAPLGLLGFGMTTVLLNLHNAGFYELNSMILSMGICYGGAAQIIAGIMEWRKGNTFATTAFLSYGLFWLSLVALIVLPKLGWAMPSNDTAMAAYLSMWGLFTAVMFVGTLRLHAAGQVVFGSLTILFFLLAIGDFINAAPNFRHFTGFEGIFCGFSAIYAGLAQVLNEVYGEVILPLGAMRK